MPCTPIVWEILFLYLRSMELCCHHWRCVYVLQTLKMQSNTLFALRASYLDMFSDRLVWLDFSICRKSLTDKENKGTALSSGVPSPNQWPKVGSLDKMAMRLLLGQPGLRTEVTMHFLMWCWYRNSSSADTLSCPQAAEWAHTNGTILEAIGLHTIMLTYQSYSLFFSSSSLRAPPYS